MNYCHRIACKLKRKLDPRYAHLLSIIEGPTVHDTLLWRRDEKVRFDEAHRKFGMDWGSVAMYVGTRDMRQCRQYFMKVKQLEEKERSL